MLESIVRRVTSPKVTIANEPQFVCSVLAPGEILGMMSYASITEHVSARTPMFKCWLILPIWPKVVSIDVSLLHPASVCTYHPNDPAIGCHVDLVEIAKALQKIGIEKQPLVISVASWMAK